MKTRDGRIIYDFSDYNHPQQWRVKNRILKNCIYKGLVQNKHYPEVYNMCYWDENGLFCNREHPDYDILELHNGLSARVNHLINIGVVKYYPSMKIFRDRKNGIKTK